MAGVWLVFCDQSFLVSNKWKGHAGHLKLVAGAFRCIRPKLPAASGTVLLSLGHVRLRRSS